MPRYFVLILFLTLMMSCEKEEEPTPTGFDEECLIDMEVEISEFQGIITSCEIEESYNCDTNSYKGSASLSLSSKINFVDFCGVTGSKLFFSDSNNTKIECTIGNKYYRTNLSEIISITNDCRILCMESEEASTELFSDRFNISTRLFNNADYVQTNMAYQFAGIALDIAAWSDIDSLGSRSGQYIFRIQLEDHNYESIFPDTSRIRFHESIVLNNQLYTNLFSNENNIVGMHGLKKKEKVYFHPENGIIAVRDSLGVLWTKDE